MKLLMVHGQFFLFRTLLGLDFFPSANLACPAWELSYTITWEKIPGLLEHGQFLLQGSATA